MMRVVPNQFDSCLAMNCIVWARPVPLTYMMLRMSDF